MPEPVRLPNEDTVTENGFRLFTDSDPYETPEEVILVPCGDGVYTWITPCTNESQRLDWGPGHAIRKGDIICP